MKAATVTMLLLAVLVAAAAAMSPPDAVDHEPAAGGIAGTLRGRGHHGDDKGHHNRSSDNDKGHHNGSSSDGDGQNTPLTELALCVSACGSNVANCIMTKCNEPLARGKGNPVMVPLCLLACTTDVMSCATNCPNGFAH